MPPQPPLHETLPHPSKKDLKMKEHTKQLLIVQLASNQNLSVVGIWSAVLRDESYTSL
jgi:hypothetical protein